ncbi:DUF3037 domain-containing protein [Arthrobacter sp. R-11]|uniref:DUF3037 domain-containing protein n=1 Tax=Arthrobacter sp. R-11 TaxID=3404053 RepID=UPI003CF22EF6
MFYQYWVVRYVPDPIRGEFVNIALLVGQDGADWAFRSVGNLRRATRLGGDPAVASYWLREFERMVARLNAARLLSSEPALSALADSGENISAAIVARLSGRLNNAVQISAPYPIVAESSQAGIEMLFEHLVADPQPRSRPQFGTRINSYVVDQFRRVGLDAAIHTRPQINVGAAHRTAGFAVTDDKVEQITNAWSFNLQDMEQVSTQIQAWAGHMGRLRSRGGSLEVKGRPRLTVPRDVQLRVVYEEPRSDSGIEALEAAQDIWSDIEDVVAYPASEQKRLVYEALDLVTIGYSAR